MSWERDERAEEQRRRLARRDHIESAAERPEKGLAMVIITWKQRPGGTRHVSEAYEMRAVVKPVAVRGDQPFIIERAHVDAAGGRGWVPANHEHATTIVCKALLAMLVPPRQPITGSGDTPVIDLGILDLPEA